MTCLVGRTSTFGRVEMAESDFSNLVAAHADRIFSGYRWYDFSPLVKSPHGNVQPDAALIATDRSEWWVVEVELARHSTRDHIESQLLRLSHGWYDQYIADYFTKKYEGIELPTKDVLRRPNFLVVVDDSSSLIADVSGRNGFQVTRLIPYLSERNDFLLMIEGWRPTARQPLGGTRVYLLADEPAARFSLTQPVELPRFLKVGSRLVRTYIEHGGAVLVLALSRSELIEALGYQDNYSIASGQLFAAAQESGQS